MMRHTVKVLVENDYPEFESRLEKYLDAGYKIHGNMYTTSSYKYCILLIYQEYKPE